MSAPVDILLIGLGSVGSLYAFLLERSGKARVTAVARSNYELLTTTGIALDTDRFGRHEGWRPHRVVKSQAEAFANGEHYALGLVTTKYLPDVRPTEDVVADALATGRVDAWSLIQNGLNVEARFAQRLGGAPLVSSAAWISAVGVDNGKQVNWRNSEVLVSGLYPPAAGRDVSAREAAALALWTDLLQAGEAHVQVSDRIDAVRFGKNVWNAIWSSMQGLLRSTPHVLAGLLPAQRESLRRFAREVVTVGYAAGLLQEGAPQYPRGGVQGDIDATLGVAFDGPGGHRMSLLIDIDQGRPIEVEGIVGGVVELARAHQLDTPVLDFVYAVLKGIQQGLLEGQA